MEKFAPETWDNQPFSTAKGPRTYTWDTSQYGGTGSYTAVGPVGDGPYYLESYNFTTNVATLKKFPDYWNATGLEALGQFTVDTYRVVAIPDRSTALQALSNGQVDTLASGGYFIGANFRFLGSDLPMLQSLGVNVIHAPELAWQEMGFNMKHPVFGTGVDTPLGMSDPSMAAEAAKDVRKAISHLIPRDQIVNDLLGGAGVPLASFLGPGWGIWYNKDLTPDSYDNNTAAALLRAAGYTVAGIGGVTTTRQGTSYWLIGGGIIAVVAVTSSTLVVVKRKRRRVRGVAARQLVSTGYAELEGLLHGGIPVGYSVLLISPPCDERDLLLRKMLNSNISSGIQVFHVSGNLGRMQELVKVFPKDFYAFCPEAHRVTSSDQNLYEIPGVGNLVEFNIVLNKGLSEHASAAKGKVIVMDLLSDLLLRHKAITTRKWLAEFIAKRKAQGFTTICTLNPAMASKEESGRITDLFDGIIEIYEKESEGRLKRFLAIRKMYGQDYSESELLLERSKLL
jgi:KaiC/GvpD/RAD55 family RecA-like ATPase